jgi:hypothetical protein
MKYLNNVLFLFFIILISCESQSLPLKSKMVHEINGRDEGNSNLTRFKIYRAKVPETWTRQDPAAHISIADTTKSLCEFLIPCEDNQQIRISIHNFPSKQIEERIPPAAQINRWKQQFTLLNSTNVSVIPQAYGGFVGYRFEGSGLMNDKETMVLAWAMQLAPEHFSTLTLHLNYNSEKETSLKQMRADYTIKASGPTFLMEKHRHAIINFANSFELIEEIPTSS